MSLCAWAGQAGVGEYAACRWYHAGARPVPTRRAGRLADRAAARIAAGRRDRLARFGVGYRQAAFAARGRTILILGQAGPDGGLVRDMTEVLASLRVRLYGRRRARDRAVRAAGCAQCPGPGA